MTLEEAITATMTEYDEEVHNFRNGPAAGRKAEAILWSETEAIDHSGVITAITGRFNHTENAFKIRQWTTMAFRLGMRAQRKLYRPTVPTSIEWRPVDYDAMRRCILEALKLVRNEVPYLDQRWDAWVDSVGKATSYPGP